MAARVWAHGETQKGGEEEEEARKLEKERRGRKSDKHGGVLKQWKQSRRSDRVNKTRLTWRELNLGVVGIEILQRK